MRADSSWGLKPDCLIARPCCACARSLLLPPLPATCLLLGRLAAAAAAPACGPCHCARQESDAELPALEAAAASAVSSCVAGACAVPASSSARCTRGTSSWGLNGRPEAASAQARLDTSCAEHACSTPGCTAARASCSSRPGAPVAVACCSVPQDTRPQAAMAKSLGLLDSSLRAMHAHHSATQAGSGLNPSRASAHMLLASCLGPNVSRCMPTQGTSLLRNRCRAALSLWLLCLVRLAAVVASSASVLALAGWVVLACVGREVGWEEEVVRCASLTSSADMWM
mmetsp:Transcript_6391/g.15871  ORF Transcript_6391/g.15871 Transcript_6391/m.15871 type:complete len:284 (-) Transcript_6391:606-1457(-)